MLDIQRIETRVKVFHIKSILAARMKEVKATEEEFDSLTYNGIDVQSSSTILENLEKFEFKKNYYYKLFKTCLSLNQNHEARRALAKCHIFSRRIDKIYRDIQLSK